MSFAAVTGYHRKSANRALCRVGLKEAEHSKRAPWLRKFEANGEKHGIYCNDPECCAILKGLWLETDQMCAPNLKEAISLWLPFYEEEHPINTSTREKVLRISAAAIGRILQPSKCRTKKR